MLLSLVGCVLSCCVHVVLHVLLSSARHGEKRGLVILFTTSHGRAQLWNHLFWHCEYCQSRKILCRILHVIDKTPAAFITLRRFSQDFTCVHVSRNISTQLSAYTCIWIVGLFQHSRQDFSTGYPDCRSEVCTRKYVSWGNFWSHILSNIRWKYLRVLENIEINKYDGV
jgi:hypothetical protein